MSDHDPAAGDTGQLANEKASDIPVTEDDNKDEYLDILGTGTLMKKVIEAGNGKRPSMGDMVKVSLIQEIPVLQRTVLQDDLDFVLGDGDVIQALDLVVALMEVGEKAMVLAGFKFMYGELGLLPDIPPNADFKLTVRLISNNGPPDYGSMNFDMRFGEAKKKKDRGNFLFKRTEYALALNSYVKASKIVDPNEGCIYTEETPEKLQELLEFRAIVLCNTSASQYKIGAYEAAVRSAKEASEMWPSYSKAYYRLGQAEEKLGNIDETIKSYKQALRYEADNSKVIHSELARLTKLNKKNKQSQQEMYSKMFWGSKPPAINKTDKVKDKSNVLAWLWKAAGGAALGAGMIGLTSYCLYKYINN